MSELSATTNHTSSPPRASTTPIVHFLTLPLWGMSYVRSISTDPAFFTPRILFLLPCEWAGYVLAILRLTLTVRFSQSISTKPKLFSWTNPPIRRGSFSSHCSQS
uniref:Uncharacterized protein n=1 Tax=Pseudictyota dubia TaxID=2749911 RepID=A0A7R9W378_9STRA